MTEMRATDRGAAKPIYANMLTVIIPAFVALFSVWFGSHLTNISTKDSSRYVKLEEMKLNSYADYSNARTRLFRGTPEDKKLAANQADEAAARIVVYGDGTVIHAIADEWRKLYHRPACSKEFLLDLAVNEAMRRMTLSNVDDPSTRGDLAVILYGCDVA